MAAYCTITDVGTFSPGLTDDASRVSAMCETASRIVDNYTGRTFPIAAIGTRTVQHVGSFVFLNLPFSLITSVTVDGNVTTAYSVESWGLLLDSTYDDATVIVSGTFGYSAVPDTIRVAATLLAIRLLLSLQLSPSTATDSGGNIAVLPEVAAVRTQDDNAQVLLLTEEIRLLLDPYRVLTIA